MRENQNEKEERKSVVKREKNERERKMQNEKDGMIRKWNFNQ